MSRPPTRSSSRVRAWPTRWSNTACSPPTAAALEAELRGGSAAGDADGPMTAVTAHATLAPPRVSGEYEKLVEMVVSDGLVFADEVHLVTLFEAGHGLGDAEAVALAALGWTPAEWARARDSARNSSVPTSTRGSSTSFRLSSEHDSSQKRRLGGAPEPPVSAQAELRAAPAARPLPLPNRQLNRPRLLLRRQVRRRRRTSRY